MRREWPDRRIVVSTTTATGQKLARERFGEENVFYFPLDFAFSVRRYLRALRPELVVVAETEFWPNFLRLAKGAGARIAVVNCRISDRSFPGYRMWRTLLRRVLANVDLFLAQSEEDARRLVEIDANASRVRSGGNLKFDIKAPPASVFTGQLRAAIAGAEHVIVCGSTVEGEEPLLLDAFRAVLAEYPSALMILAPRHPDRFDEVAAAVTTRQLSFSRRSQWQPGSGLRGGVFLLDSIGELAAVYSLASVAFVGGSLLPRGGHNILEPAQHGVPILVGPFTFNFRDIVSIFLRAGAVHVVQPHALKDEWLRLLRDPEQRRALGSRAAQVFAAQSGATDRAFAAMTELIGASGASEPAARNEQPAPPARV
jgi:3-deoxy-D-manno-octulosonic-acid transferase